MNPLISFPRMLTFRKMPGYLLSLLSLNLLVFSSLLAQTPASLIDPDPTRWISYSQTYYKIPIAENGLYRLTTTELQRAGVPTGQIDPITVQVFHRGVEQAIYVEGETDRQFDAGDFLEFYGQKNDGAQDSLLYRPYQAQPHSYYSLFNDTTAYFLTWQPSGKPGKRMTAYTDTTFVLLTPERYHWADELRLFTDTYPGWAAGLPAKIESSYYEVGEGYTGVVQQKDKPYNTVFQLLTPYRNGPDPQIDVLLTGRDITNHRIDCWLGPTATTRRLVDSVRFVGYTNAHIRHDANWSDMGSDGQLIVSTVSRGEFTNTDLYSVSYIRLQYPQKFVANTQPINLFRLEPNAIGRSLIDLPAIAPDTRFWDISDPTVPICIGATASSPGSARLIVRGTQNSRIMLSTSQPKSVPGILPVNFTNWTNRKPTYLIISHDSLMKSLETTVGEAPGNAVQAYATYRASAAGGGHDTLTATMQQLFDQYSYGERHPLAIRRFARQMLNQSKNTLQYLLLIGRSRSTPGIRRDPQQATLDMVMTAGFPGSDAVFTAGLHEAEPDIPAIPTGRINAGTPQEVLHYLNKVKEYESPSSDALWRKNFLHLSGGQTPGELDLFRQLVDSYQKQAVGQSLGAHVTTRSKVTDNPVEQLDVAKPVNEGVGLITFFGHSGLDVTDLDIGFCSSDAPGYRNKGKYPLLLVNGCAIGNFFYGRPTLATDWVLTPDRGAIAAIAQSHLGYADVMHLYTTLFYNLLTDSAQLDKSIGQLQQETIRRVLAQSSDGRALANGQQMVLQGDPAIRLFPVKTPDYGLTAGGVTIQDANRQPLTTLSDSIQIRAVVQNTGQYWQRPLPVRVRRLVNGQESAVFTSTIPNAVTYRDTLTLTFPNDHTAEGQNQFEVTINPTGLPTTHTETNHSNNQAIVEVTLPSPRPVLIYPPPGSMIQTTTVRLTAQYVTGGLHRFDLELDSTARFDSPFRVTQQLTATDLISYPTLLSTRPNATYYWRVRLADKPANTPSNDSIDWVTGSFMYAPDSHLSGLPEGQIRLSGALPTDSQQGDTVTIPVQFTNLSPYPFADSLVVRQTIYSAGLSSPILTQWRVKAPTDQDTLQFTMRIATEKLPGTNRISLTINPHLQPEYSFLNNTLDLQLPVQPDLFGPLLEVAFDGARISDGAIVSAQPRIDVLVADDNRSLLRHDTTGLNVYLQGPGKNAPFERLSWRNATMLSGEKTNVFRLQYPLPKLGEGLYHVRVTAQDAVGNPAVPYQVGFRVVNERKLTSLRVYPNPFREQTLFSLQLTGEKAPDSLTLTLTDLNGREVRRLTPLIG